MSANVEVDIDPVDAEFNVNKELGYEGKHLSREEIEKNLNKMIIRLEELKKIYKS